MLLGVDVGGTFTDAVLLGDGTVHTAKVPTTPGEESRGVMAAIDAVLAEAGAEPADVESFAHGMTVGTNALLEERGARTALIATKGFADLLEIARQDRPSLYHLCAPKPTPLIGAELKLEADERTGPEGIVEPLADGEPERLAAALEELGAESVAICLLFSYLDPTHERRLAEHLRAALPGLHVSASHEVLPRFREYERASTTAIDAYLSPLLARYLGRLEAATDAAGLPAPQVMLSSGGVAPAEEAARAGAWSVLSGPAGGAVGAGLLARLSGDGNALGFDMGGTSCDVCVVEDGAVRRTDSRTIGGRPIQLPTVDVHTVGAGGGSIGWRDPGGALRVGPRSAGAQPGPACYGRGGTEPTVTDANLLLGNLAADSTLAGGVALDAEAAERAIGALAEELGLDPLETAAGIVRVANQEMVRALRVVTVERGVDPRRFALLPFGGAGPMHAAAIAEELGIERLICPRAGGVLSAFGLCASDRRRDTARTVMLSGPDLTAARIAASVTELRESAGVNLTDARAEVVYGMRYAGQAFELDVPGEPEPDPQDLIARFEETHESRYGHRDPDSDVVLVDIRLALVMDGPGRELGMALTHEQRGGSLGPSPTPSNGTADEGSRPVHFDGEWLDTPVLRGAPEPGTTATSPVVFELPEATLILPPGWSARVDEFGSILATRSSRGGASDPERTSPQFVSEGSLAPPHPERPER
jgi:N-methylhydantoinase A